MDGLFHRPPSWELREVNSQKMHWMRVRLLEGYFSRMRLDRAGPIKTAMSILCRSSSRVRQCSMSFASGTSIVPPKTPPGLPLHQRFRMGDHTQDVNWRTAAFAPYRPVRDNTPTLYFGFDRPLPADMVSLFLDIEESTGQPNGRRQMGILDGNAWLVVAVDDETTGLALPGILAVTWPARTAAFRNGRPEHGHPAPAEGWARGRAVFAGRPALPAQRRNRRAGDVD